jgi:hypothetical protein
MTPSQAFKTGFVARCIEENLSLEQIASRVKVAADIFFEKEGDFLGNLSLGTAGLAAMALAAPPVAGGAGGWLAAKLHDSNSLNAEELENREVAEEYKKQTDRLRMITALRKRKYEQPTPSRLYL